VSVNNQHAPNLSISVFSYYKLVAGDNTALTGNL